MIRPLLISLIILAAFNRCYAQIGLATVDKLEMNLSAFGVEADNFPSIRVYVDFAKDSSNCEMTYYDPAIAPTSYKLSSSEIAKILGLLKAMDPERLNKEYTVSKTDQPTSITKIFTPLKTYTIKDYGLVADGPLREVYKIAYKY